MSFRPYQSIINAAAGQATSSKIELTNQSGLLIAALQPVTIDSNGYIKRVDITNEVDAVKTVGLALANIANNSSGDILVFGRADNVSIPFTFGDYLYVSKTGGLTSSFPTEGYEGFVTGDFVIRVGVVARNTTTPSNKDILVSIGIIGQL
jgi:hypothetical protein